MTPKKSRRSVGRTVRIPKKSKPKPYKQEPSAFFDQVEDLSSPDAKVKKEIEERREEEKSTKGA